MKLNRKWMLVIALMLSIAVATGGTLAYLSDTDADVNTMTLGSVYIVQNEQERDAAGDLVEFEQNKDLLPAVFDGSSIPWADEDKWPGDGGEPWKVVADNSAVVDKFVTVTNTGKSDAYVRTIIAYEGDETYGPEGAYIHVVHNSENVAPAITVECHGVMTISDVKYTVYSYTYTDKLAPQATTIPSLKQLYMNKAADNNVVKQYGEKYDVLVLSQAIQAQGFKDAATALEEGFGEITEEKLADWLKNTPVGSPGEKNETNNPPYPVVLSDASQLIPTLKQGISVAGAKGVDLIASTDGAIELDAKGAYVKMNGIDRASGQFGYVGFVPPAGEDATISNLTVEGRGFVEIGHHHGDRIDGGGDYTVTNLTIKNLVATLNINNCGNNIAGAFTHYGNATLTNCTMTGATTEAEGFKPYDAAFVNGTKTIIDGGKYGTLYLANQAHVTITGAEVDTIDSYAITYKNLGKLTIGAGAKVGTINLAAPGSFSPSLVIEDGATVDTITYNGVTYTQAEWMAR